MILFLAKVSWFALMFKCLFKGLSTLALESKTAFRIKVKIHFSKALLMIKILQVLFVMELVLGHYSRPQYQYTVAIRRGNI